MEEHEQLVGQRQGLAHRERDRGDGDEQERARRLGPAGHEQQKAHPAHRGGLRGEDQAAQQDVENGKHVRSLRRRPAPHRTSIMKIGVPSATGNRNQWARPKQASTSTR